ncbi:flagellar export chaperone FliS [bacterium]|nr:flagellar export chaperone FliS [bacterium]MBU1984561.1 flagellar export chaperone FliS [bacterium]
MKLDTSHTLYKQADVSCSRPQLVLLLCDGAIRYLREASDHLQAGRWAEKGRAVDAAHECLRELRRGLDFNQGGEVAATLDKMYDFLGTKLMIANIKREPEQFRQIIQSLEGMRDAWRELFQRLQSEGRLAEVNEFQPTVLR